MKIFEVATGFTPIPAKIGAATEIVIQNLVSSFSEENKITLIDVENTDRNCIDCPVVEIKMASWLMRPGSIMSIKHKLKRIIYSFKLAMRIKKILKKESSDIIFHFHNQYNFAFTYWWCSSILKKKKEKVRFVYTLHTPLWSENIKNILQYAKKKYFLEIYSMKHADLVIVLNPNAEKNIRSYFNDYTERIVGIPNGVNTDVFYPIQSEKSSSPLNFVSVGSICDRKNQLDTIKLLHPVLKEKNAHFSFAGAVADSKYMREIEQYMYENQLEKHVSYLGEKCPGKDLNDVYNSNSIYISQSKSEAFSLVILEAMSAGLPVLLSENFRSSLEGTPQCDSISFCELDDDFYEEINSYSLDQSKLNKLSITARKYIEDHFSWRHIAKLHKDIFSKQFSS